MSRRRLSKKKIREILAQCLFDPNAPGPMKVCVDMNNPDYLRHKATEILMTERPTMEDVRQAISLLALNVALREIDA